ncbi:MAG: hypothetical protein L0G99_13930 [Propionibacteriales bacterium]|nr:hypothetical protein [Propionibacteriales bacterium]
MSLIGAVSGIAAMLLVGPVIMLGPWFKTPPRPDTAEPGVVERALAEISASAGSDWFIEVVIESDSVRAAQADGGIDKWYFWEGLGQVRVSELSSSSVGDQPFRPSDVQFAGFARAWAAGLPEGQKIRVQREMTQRGMDGPVSIELTRGGPDGETLNPDFTRK